MTSWLVLETYTAVGAQVWPALSLAQQLADCHASSSFVMGRSQALLSFSPAGRQGSLLASRMPCTHVGWSAGC